MDWAQFASPLLSFGISTGLSLISGRIQKNHTPLSNKPIPYRNATMMGTGAAAITQDPVDSVAAILGGFAASFIHTGLRKVF